MRFKLLPFSLLLVLVLLNASAFGQPPCQNGPDGLIYIQGGATIQNYNPALPISATNPVANTIPNGGSGLAVANNLNGPGPSPTFYAISGTNWVYWNGTTWVNTGHSAGAGGAVNPGGGGNFVYSLVGNGDVYKYDGTGPSTLLLNVPGFSGGGPYDLVGDCDGGFYILRTNASTTPAPFLRKYDSNGNLVQAWTATGTSGSAGGGFAIVGNTVYYHNGGGFHSGQLSMSSTTVNFSPNPAAIPNPSDMASCPVCLTGVDTFYYCQGAPPLGLSTTNLGTITWTVQSGNATVTGAGNNVSVTAASTAVITATSNANSTVDSFVVIAVTGVVNAGVDRTLAGCDPYSGVLNGLLSNTDSNFTYTIAWSPTANIVSGGNTLTPAISQSGITTYTLAVSTPATTGGCLWQDSLVVDVEDFTPIAQFDFDRKLGCVNDTVDFTNTSLLNPNGNPSFFWTYGDGNFNTGFSPRHIYGMQNSYNVNLMVTDNGCTDDTTITVDVRHPLQADFLITNTGTAGDDSICLGSAFVFSPSTIPLAGTGNLSIDWDFGDGTVLTAQNSTQQVYQYAAAGTYSVKMMITDTLGCQDSVRKTVFVDVPAYVQLSAAPTNLCVGGRVYFVDSVAPNTFSVTYDFGDGTVLSGLHNPTHTYERAGTYVANINAQYLVCPDEDTSITIQVNAYPTINLGEDVTLCPGWDTAVILRDINNPAQLLDWSTGVTAPNISVGMEATGRYFASAANQGCVSTDSIWVKRDCYLNIPNSFSPNGDGQNDYFIPREMLSSGVIEFDMKIMNRWGEVIFKTNSINGRGWDGKYGGTDQPVGVYVYLINARWKNGFRNSFQGNVTLVR